MKRDMDLVRQILLKTEALKTGEHLTQIEGVPPDLFTFHVAILEEAELLRARHFHLVEEGRTGTSVSRLTWAGCDFLDAVRSDTLWKKAKESVIKPSASWTFDVLKEWLKTEIASGLPTLRGLAN